MNVHTEFVDKILFKRQSHVDSLLVGDLSLQLNLVDNIPDRLNQLDRIAYTIEFLEKQNLIKVLRNRGSVTTSLFDFKVKEIDDDLGYFFQATKLIDDFRLVQGWKIIAEPGLLVFQSNGYKTDEQLNLEKSRVNAICAALAAAFFTAVFTTIGNWYI